MRASELLPIPTLRLSRSLLAALLSAAAVAGAAHAASSVTLPSSACTAGDSVFDGDFDRDSAPTDASHGSGGAYPGNATRALHIANLGSGTQTYYVYVPGSYDPARSLPLLLALDGVAPLASAGQYATDVRDAWITAAEAGGFIVAAPVGHALGYTSKGEPYVSWSVPPTNGPNDYDLFAAVRADLESAYNIERTRVYGWGFSAGGHVMHDLGVHDYSHAFNATTMAAYAVSGGDLAALACAGMSGLQCREVLAAVPRKIPVDIHIGYYDPNNGAAKSDHMHFLDESWLDAQTIFFTEFNGGHIYTAAQLSDTWAHLCANAVVP